MNYKKLAGMCIMIPMLLSACGNQQAAQSANASDNGAAQTQQSTQNQSGTQPNQDQSRPSMNPQTRQMMSTFQTLMMMDKQEGLSITKEEASAMLPIAQDSVTKGELTADDRTKLLEKLTADQKKYIDDAAAKMKERGNNSNNGRANSGNDNLGNKPDRANNQNASNSPNQSNNQDQPNNGDQSNNQPASNKDGQGKNRPAGGMKNIGQQFVELLQNKIK